MVRDAIVNSFYAAHGGHSIDWLLANPQLQAAFHDACRETGLIGSPADWNRELLRFRKTGEFPKRGTIQKVHVADDELRLQALEEEWAKYVTDPCREAGVPPPKLVVVTSPYRRLYAPLMEFLAERQRIHPGRPIAVVVPELMERRWYHYLLHNQTRRSSRATCTSAGWNGSRWSGSPP